MMGVYYAEQTHPFPRYKNDFEKFKVDWEAKKYECEGASLVLSQQMLKNSKPSAKKFLRLDRLPYIRAALSGWTGVWKDDYLLSKLHIAPPSLPRHLREVQGREERLRGTQGVRV